MSETLRLAERIENNDDIIMRIYDMCNDKKDYKRILNFCREMGKEFKALKKEKEMKIYQIKKIMINDITSARCYIMNFQPEFYSDISNPLEIKIVIDDNSKNGFTTYGSSKFGGCNEAEFNEFLGIISSGYSDFTKEL